MCYYNGANIEGGDEVDKVVTGKAITTEKRLQTLKRRFFRPAALESKHVSTPSPAPRPGMLYGNIFPGVAALPFYSCLYMPRGQLEGTFFFASSRTRRLYSSLLVLPPDGKAWDFGVRENISHAKSAHLGEASV